MATSDRETKKPKKLKKKKCSLSFIILVLSYCSGLIQVSEKIDSSGRLQKIFRTTVCPRSLGPFSKLLYKMGPDLLDIRYSVSQCRITGNLRARSENVEKGFLMQDICYQKGTLDFC